MAKKLKAPPMVMKPGDVEKRLRLLRMWDWQCVLCGECFESLHSVTIEHLIPRAYARGLHDNQAPSHYNCNNFRQTMSLLDANYTLARKRRVMGRRPFLQWVNAKVPNRIIPDALLAISTQRPEKPLPGFEFIRLPLWLPGM